MGWTPTFVRIGSDFKIYQYVRGQYFKPHRDGDVSVDGVTSLVTVLVYLNDADGGTTVIMLVLSGAGSMTVPR
jgi:prolyl 4-hydroxylase